MCATSSKTCRREPEMPWAIARALSGGVRASTAPTTTIDGTRIVRSIGRRSGRAARPISAERQAGVARPLEHREEVVAVDRKLRAVVVQRLGINAPA